jgi:hypothetical protein
MTVFRYVTSILFKSDKKNVTAILDIAFENQIWSRAKVSLAYYVMFENLTFLYFLIFIFLKSFLIIFNSLF